MLKLNHFGHFTSLHQIIYHFFFFATYTVNGICYLVEFPYEIGYTKKLEILHAGHNAISEIPRSFSKLANLKEFYCQSNKLTLFPKCLCELKNLNILDLSKNRIKELPEHMETLQVMELNMNKNKLKRLPESLGACPRLKVLRVEENQLKLDAITSEFLINSLVSLLAVDGNLFEMKDLDEVNGYDQVGNL